MFKLLIADDENFVRKGLISNLPWNKMGITAIEQADDGVKALKIASMFCPDIVLSDIRMPNMDGIELAAQIRKLFPDCKIIFMSAYSDKEYLKSAISLKAISFVEKPINLDEINEAIQQAVAQCKEEESERTSHNAIEAKLQENLSAARNSVVLDLIGRKINKEAFEEILRAVKWEFKLEGLYTVFVLKLKKSDDTNFDMELVFRHIRQAITPFSTHVFSGYKSNDYVITIVNSTVTYKSIFAYEKLYQMGSSIISELKEFCESFVGVGKPVKGIENICLSHQSAVIALQSLFYKGYNHCAVFEDMNDHSFIMDEAFQEKFRNILESENSEDALDFIKKLTEQCKQNSKDVPNRIKDIYFKLMLIVFDAARKRGLEFPSEDRQDFIWDIMSRYDTLAEVEECLLAKIEAFFNALKEAKAGSKTVSTIMQIIYKEYGDSELSIKSISQNVFLSDAYLCVIFKRETGKTINQYMTEVRIRKAAELLRNKSIKLSEVAKRVGYSDHNYFTKTFKKLTGMTPSEYKERYFS